jgi:dipeptidyl aminopeptidase/acylaminoacyl peptidase
VQSILSRGGGYRLRRTAALALGGLLLVAFRAPSEEPSPRRKEIADLEQQLGELNKRVADVNKRLAELKQGQPANSLRPLGLTDAASWRAIGGATLSPDGKWFGYRAGPAEGDGEVVLRATTGDQETKWPAGSGFGAIAFARDSKWFAFTVNPPAEKGASTAPVGRRPPGQSKVVLVNTASGDKTEFEGVRRFAFSGDAATHLAVHRAPVANASGAPASGAPAVPAGAPPGASPAASATGTDLLLHELATGAQLNLGNVADFGFDKKGRWLALVIDSPGQTGNGVQIRDMTTAALVPLDTSKATYRSLVWTEKGDGFTVLKGVEDKAYAGKHYSVVGFSELGAKAKTSEVCKKTVFDPREHKDFPSDMTVSPDRAPAWTEDLGGFVFGIHELKKKDEKTAGKDEPKKDDKTGSAPGPKGPGPKGSAPTTPDAGKDRPDLVIWHWADERLQSQQQVQAVVDKSFSYLCAYRVQEKRFLRLADDSLRQVSPAPHDRWAIGLATKPYQRMSTLDGRRYQDVFVVDMHSGAKRKLLTKNRWYFGPSTDGTHFLYYDDGHFHTCELATGKTFVITQDVPVSFVNAENDVNVAKAPRPPAGWTKAGDAVLLSDGWDIWKVPVHGGAAVNLTVDGKRDAIRYGGLTTLDPEDKGLDFAKPVYVSLHGQWTKKAGFGRIDPGKTGVTRLSWDDAAFSRLVKARAADVFVYTRETYKDYPDYCICDATFKGPRRLTHANPQQDQVAWCGGVRLLDYTSTKGEKLQAALFLPAHHEPGKRYPTIVYIYERLSDRLNHYAPPSASGFSAALYTSNGYAVLMPDIKYHVNDPGRSAVWCVLPALDAAVAAGVVDKSRVGLHGHSWGGYQTAFLITQTDAFQAAVAGAPLTNLVSMYSSIYWNTGSANQPIFESSQGRFSAPYWDDLDAYIRNSPVYHAKNVKTPLLLLHNDKDGAVDWNQGIEYFNTLRRLEKAVVMLQYKGENHGVAKPANRKDYSVRMREFFDHHLLGKAAPAWLRDGVPHLKLDDHMNERATEAK